jgi:DNA mismatch repair protein MutH
MRLTDVFDKLTTLYYRPFSELKQQEDISSFTINKGNTGQFLQELLNMPNNSHLTDFEDGELKTNKADKFGKPKETMFITQISQDFDSLFFGHSHNNRLLHKISNLLYLPVCKDSHDPNDWFFLPAYHINARENNLLYQQFEQDFLTIKSIVLHDIENTHDGSIHTSNGKYIQIRSKDAKRANGQYNPIFSQHLERYVSNKNHAFYFKKEFMLDVQQGIIPARKIE